MTYAFLAFVALAVLAACLDHQATRPNVPTHPYDDLLHRQMVLTRRENTTKGEPPRGERHRPSDVADLPNSFDPTYFNDPKVRQQ